MRTPPATRETIVGTSAIRRDAFQTQMMRGVTAGSEVGDASNPVPAPVEGLEIRQFTAVTALQRQPGVAQGVNASQACNFTQVWGCN
jgi:hypothetical protein